MLDNLDITSLMDGDRGLAYTQRILKGYALKHYREVMILCRSLAKELAGNQWNLSKLSGISADVFWTWAKVDTKGHNGYTFIVKDE